MQDMTMLAPTGLMCELLAQPALTEITTAWPTFSWIVSQGERGLMQAGYRLLLADDPELLAAGTGNVADTRRVESGQSLHVRCPVRLEAQRTYFWKVKIWSREERESGWSEPQCFRTGRLTDEHRTPAYPIAVTLRLPVVFCRRDDGAVFVDFGKAAFATLELDLPADAAPLTVHLGEARAGSFAINPSPGGSIRYRRLELNPAAGDGAGAMLGGGMRTHRVTIPPDRRNTDTLAIRMPVEVGEVLPFRYAVLENLPPGVEPKHVRQRIAHYPFNDAAALFRSSNAVLNDVWDLCHYTMKATSFTGLYVDGDRERIPYEGDAYINQLGHYCVDREYTMARRTHEFLLRQGTWFAEWTMTSLLMAWAEVMYTGDLRALAAGWEDLSPRTLAALARADGLIATAGAEDKTAVLESIHHAGLRGVGTRKINDLVDWPPAGMFYGVEIQGERDGYEMKPVNTVVNAYHFRALALLARMAALLGKTEEARALQARATQVAGVINEMMFDAQRGVYVDGLESAHASLHANMFPLAFGLTPAARVPTVLQHVLARGMACSVYGAQHLLDALYKHGCAQEALALLTATHDRSWAHMIYGVGSTIALEAWDNRYKPNQDWNHAWGAAPANLIPRRLMGVRPGGPGFDRVRIQPQTADLAWARLRMPTIRGEVQVEVEAEKRGTYRLRFETPGNTRTDLDVTLPPGAGERRVEVDGKTVAWPRDGRLVMGDMDPGRHEVLCR